MEKEFNKITVGFVIQKFEEKDGKMVCTEQNFVAGDQVDYEDVKYGEPLKEVPDYQYQPYTMIVTGAK